MAAMTDMEVNNLPQLFSALVGLHKQFGIRPWWRGQAVLDWGLLAAIHRQGKAYSEYNLTNRFRAMAKPRYPACPDSNDLPSWLFLMQHYRLPTRLLDWSESPLVALFFAIENRKHDDADGALWALHPTMLNKAQTGEATIFGSSNARLQPLFRATFQSGQRPPEQVLSVNAEQIDTRQMVQQAKFTIHASRAPMNEHPSRADFLARIRIPKGTKETFRQSIQVLSISRETLFPDLENLSTVLRELVFAE